MKNASIFQEYEARSMKYGIFSFSILHFPFFATARSFL